MVIECQYSGGRLSLDDNLLLGAGGEGNIYELPGEPRLAAKVYHPDKRTSERAAKLKAMLANAPHDHAKKGGHTSIAWPVELLSPLGDDQTVIGFLMPRLVGAYNVHILYDVEERHAKCPLLGYDSLCRAARNIASAVWALHESGYVIGDVNESNIMVTQSAMVTLLDTDSFQVRDRAARRVYRCPVGTDMFTPPELQGINFAEVDRSQEHDLFGLAVLFFRLLMEGSHPFACVMPGTGEPVEYGECLARGYFPYGGGDNSIIPSRLAPPFEMLHPQLRSLFQRCFVKGHAAPRSRPDARTWYRALKDSESALVTCSRNEQHKFFSHCSACSWCERAQRLRIPNWDPFPSVSRARSARVFSYSAAQTAARAKRAAPSATTYRKAPTPSATPPPSSFSASTATVAIGQAVTLQWAIPNAQAIRITDQSGHSVFAGTAPSGFVTLYPRKTRTYSLAASGTGVNLPNSVTVTVVETPLPEELRASHLDLNQPFPLKTAQVDLLPALLLKDVVVRLRSLLKLKSFSRLGMYGRLRGNFRTL
jgi:DNA-binding helix-hairpin-helix protein with protein kinase domain